MQQLPKVSIIILNYKTYEDTLSVIDNIYEKLNYNNYDIIVVDNASPNESYTELAAEYKNRKFNLLKSEKNGGYALGNNIGIRHSYKLGSEYSLILNNDIILNDSNVLLKMVELMESNPKIGAVSPRIIKPNGEEDYPFIKRPNIWEMSFGYLLYAKKRKIRQSKNKCIYRPQGCCMLLRNSDMKKIGEMDESTFLYCEEDILAERLLQVNQECWLCSETQVIHNHSKTIYTVMEKKSIAKCNVRSYRIYLNKYRKIKNPLLVGLISVVKYAVIYLRY